jgi:hypothetical protein
MASSITDLRRRRRTSWRASLARDRHEPRPDSIRIAQASELAPGDQPGGLDGFIGEVEVTADHKADPGHVVVIGADDPREGSLVAGSRERHRPSETLIDRTRNARHISQMLGEGSSDSRTEAQFRAAAYSSRW